MKRKRSINSSGGKKSKVLLILVMLAISILFSGMTVSAEKLLIPRITIGSGFSGLEECLPATLKHILSQGEETIPYTDIGWCGRSVGQKGDVVGMQINGSDSSVEYGFPESTFVTRIEIKNHFSKVNTYPFASDANVSIIGRIMYITGDGSVKYTSDNTIAYGSIYSFPINEEIVCFNIMMKCTAPGSINGLEYKVWGTPAGSSIAWNDITGKPALAAASHDHSSISGNAATATNATYATNAGNADTVDSKHASDFTVAGGTVAWSNITGKPTTVEGYGITDGQRQMFTVIKGFKFDAYAVGSYTSPTGLATTSILSGAATKITGTLSTAGPTVVDCSSNKKLYFNVIEAPADDTTATVTFM